MTRRPPTKLNGRRPLAWLRHRLRSSELWLVGLATLVGAAAGLLAVLQSRIAHDLQSVLYGIDVDQRLSAVFKLTPPQLIWLPIGGLGLGVSSRSCGAGAREPWSTSSRRTPCMAVVSR